MALTVTSRPAKEIDGLTSTWNAVNLPIQYKFNSDLFPVNSVDTIFAASSFSNNGGFLQVTLGAASANTLEGETIQLSSCDVDSFNGVWKIKEVVDTSNFVLYVAYDSTLTAGDFQKYYNNYFAEVKVYSGLPDFHPDYLDKPIAEVGTLRLVPNADNEIIASFSGIIKSDVNFNNQLSSGINLDCFTGFFVEWREGYDQNVNDEIATNYTAWDFDTVAGSGVDQITNGTFDTDLSGWTQVDAAITSEPFTWNAGQYAESNLITYRKSKIIYQEVNLSANIKYDFTVNITRTNSIVSKFVIYGTNDLLNYYVLYSNEDSGNVNIVDSVVPTSDYQYIGYHFYKSETANTTVTIDSITLTPSGEYLFWGSNSALQFQNIRGGNMYDYIEGNPSSKFMTNFDMPTLFTGNYYDVSFINEESPSDIDFGANVLVRLRAKDINQADATLLTTWSDTSGNGEDFTASAGKEPTFYTSGGVNNKPCLLFSGSKYLDNLTINISQPFIVYWVGKISTLTGGKPVLDGVDASDRLIVQYSFSNNAWAMSAGTFMLLDTFPDIVNGDVCKFVFDGTMSRGIIDNVDQTIEGTGDAGSGGILKLRIGALPNGLGSDKFTGSMSEIIIVSADADPCTLIDIEKYLANEYGTYEYSNKAILLNQYEKGVLTKTDNLPISNNYTGVYRYEVPALETSTDKIDISLYKAGECKIMETKTINVDSSCSQQEIYLTWLNSLGGWEYWKFTAEKTTNLDVSSKETIKRNIFNNWDDTFINGDTENDVINVRANKDVDVYSQYLTLDEVKAISTIKYSTKVMVINGTDKTTVIVDSGSISVYNDGDDETLHTIKFNIQYPDIQIQSQ